MFLIDFILGSSQDLTNDQNYWLILGQSYAFFPVVLMMRYFIIPIPFLIIF